jgi:hypothetical protein
VKKKKQKKELFLTNNYLFVASDERVKEWYDRYADKLEPLEERHGEEEAREIDANWRSRWGNKAAFSDYLHFFHSQFNRLTRVDMVNDYILEMLPGLWTSAFHCLIEIGFSLFANHDPSFIRGIAYLASSFQPLDTQIDSLDPIFSPPATDIWEILQEIKNDMLVDWNGALKPISGFQSRLRHLAKTESLLERLRYFFGRAKSLFSDTNLSSSEISSQINLIAFQLFLQTGANDFFLLHCITALHALQPVLLYVKEEKDRIRALNHFLYFFLAVYIVRLRPRMDIISDAASYLLLQGGESQNNSKIGSPPILHAPTVWDSIISKVISYDDEHVIKLVYVAKWNYDRWISNDSTSSSPSSQRNLFLAVAKANSEKVASDGTGWRF